MTRTPKRPRDANQLAKMVVDIATGENQDSHESAIEVNSMAALGRLGGLKGGRVRAEKLTDERRAEIARTAAAKRWKTGRTKRETKLLGFLTVVLASTCVPAIGWAAMIFKQDANSNVISVSKIVGNKQDCHPYSFAGKVVHREFKTNSVTLSGFTIESGDGTRAFINVDPPSPDLDMVTLDLLTNGLQRLSRIGRNAKGRAFACGAAGRISVLDEIR